MHRLALLALLPLVLLAACGGGGDEEEGEEQSAAEPIAKAEYIEQADEICASDDAQAIELDVEFDAAVASGDTERTADVLEQVTDLSRDNFAEVEALPPPDEDEDALQEVFDAQDEVIELTEDLTAEIRADSGHYQELVDAQSNAREEVRKAAEEFGFVECGVGGS